MVRFIAGRVHIKDDSSGEHVLRLMQGKQTNEEPTERDHEERAPRDQRSLSDLWDRDVQDRRLSSGRSTDAGDLLEIERRLGREGVLCPVGRVIDRP